jgi:ABC-type phosphate/phosphonate transport system substrate-binding protein
MCPISFFPIPCWLPAVPTAPRRTADLPHRLHDLQFSEKETLDRFLPLTKYLGEKLGANFEAVAIDTNDFMKEVDNLDFTHTNSLLYIMMQRFNGVESWPVKSAVPMGIRLPGSHPGSQEKRYSDNRGSQGEKHNLRSDACPHGFMSQIDLLERNGIDPEEDLAFYTIPSGSFKHEKVIYGVMFEKYDAAAIPIFDFELMAEEGRINPEEFVIVAEGPVIPYCNFGVSQRVDEQFAQRFKNALVNLTMDDTVEFNGERVSVLARSLTDGFEALQDSDFDIVRDMARRTNMPPYQEF